MTENKDLYEALGVHPNVPQEEIRDAYRRKVKKHHPDAGGSAENFLVIQEAWETLGNPQSRAAYDRDRRESNTAYSSTGTAQFNQGFSYEDIVRMAYTAAQEANEARLRQAAQQYQPPQYQSQSTQETYYPVKARKTPIWLWIFLIPLTLITLLIPGTFILTTPAILAVLYFGLRTPKQDRQPTYYYNE